MAAAHPPPSAPHPGPSSWRQRWRARRARREGVVLERGTAIGRRVHFELAPGARLEIGHGVVVGDGCRFHLGPSADVRLGAGTRLGSSCVVSAHASVIVGAGCRLADEVVLVDFGPRPEEVERPLRSQGVRAEPIIIGDRARLGPGAVVQGGAQVPPEAVVPAKAVVAPQSVDPPAS